MYRKLLPKLLCAGPRAREAISHQGLTVKATKQKQVPSARAKGEEMSERLETLKKARHRMVEDRDAHAKVLAAPFDRDKAERARTKFAETQSLIDAIDRAIHGEECNPSANQ